jgi:hypothetical protein
MTTIFTKVTNRYQLPANNGKNIPDYVRSKVLPALFNQSHTEFYETLSGEIK